MTGPGLNVPRNDPRMPALRRIRPAGLLLVCAALLDLLFCLVVGVTLMLGIQLLPLPKGMDPTTAAPPETWQIVFTFAGVVLTRGLTLWGAWGAFSLRRWHLALVGSLTIMTPLAPACCLGLPVGAWMVFVLLDPDVRKHFT